MPSHPTPATPPADPAIAAADTAPSAKDNDPATATADHADSPMAEPDPPAAATDAGGPRVKFKVAFKSTVYEMDLPATAPVAILKQELEKKTGIDSNLQKLLFKGVLKDDQSLSDAKVTEGCKIILMASAAKDIINVVATPTNSTSSTASSPSAASAAPAYILDAPEHKRIIERGPPENVEKGLVGVKSAIPPLGIPNLVNVRRIKTRLSFLATDELQIATGELTQKIPYSSISKVISEPIKGHDGYHAVGIQIGPTEKSLAWFYWVPSQYVDAIKEKILGPLAQYGFFGL